MGEIQILKILSLLTICVDVLFFSGCKRDTPCQPTFIYQNILSSERPAFIYKGSEKLTFIRHPQLDTLILIGGVLDSSYSPTKGDQSDCPTETEGQSFEVIFKGTIKTIMYTIDVNIWKNNPDFDASRMNIYFRIDLVSGAGSSGGYMRPSIDFVNSNLLETDTINNKIYKDVLKISLNQASMLYSQVYGIIKMELYTNGEYLELLKKE